MTLNSLKEHKAIIITIIIVAGIYLIENNKRYTNDGISSYQVNAIATSYGVARKSRISNDSFIQDNYIELETKNSKKSKDKIEEHTKLNGGVINQINSFNILNKVGYNIAIKIPTEKVDKFIDNIIKLEGKVINENFSIQNVTNQYNDNIDIINNLTLRRNRLRELMQKNDKIDDVLKIDKELTNVQNQLNNLNKNNKNLENDIKLTTINITLNPEVFLYSGWSINSSFQKALQNLIIFSQKLVDLIIYLILFSPYLLLVYLLYIVFKIFKK